MQLYLWIAVQFKIREEGRVINEAAYVTLKAGQ